MVIGAYIVTSYFIFVEKHPDRDKQDIYQSIETVIADVIQDQEDLENYRLDDSETEMEFEFAGLLDRKSLQFIRKYDSVMSQVFDTY